MNCDRHGFVYLEFSLFLKKFVQKMDKARWSARHASAIESPLGQDGRIADVILVVLCQIGFDSFVCNCEQAFQTDGIEGTISISSVWKKGGKGEDHVAASLSW